MKSLLGNRRKRHSLDRLRVLYADLLQHIDVSDDGQHPHVVVGRKRGDADEEAVHVVKRTYKLNFWRRSDSGDSIDNAGSKKRDLTAAFRFLAATKSPDKDQGDNGGAIAIRDDASVSALAMAKTTEVRVSKIIQEIGDVIVNGGEPTMKSDSVFEYFCEKSILSLLVDICRQTPSSTVTPSEFHGVVWSPLVKAQVLQTCSRLIASVRDPAALFYLLSQNYMNELVLSMLPIHQWTDPASVKLLPVYVELLRTLALQLATSPSLFPFLTQQEEDGTCSFPLFSAALDTATSSFAQSDSHVHSACLSILVDILRIPNKYIRSWLSKATEHQHRLADHVCQRLWDRYQRISNLTTGPIVDPVRSNAIGGQLSGLHMQIDFLNDLFGCGLSNLNVRLCESLLSKLVARLLSLLLDNNRLTGVGLMDADVVPRREALSQTAVVVFYRLFAQVAYRPFLRMLAVTLFHPLSTPLWARGADHDIVDDYNDEPQPVEEGDNEYILTTALNALVQQEQKQSNSVGADKEEKEETSHVENPYRNEIAKALRGDYGDWIFISHSILLQIAIESEALDVDTLLSLSILPPLNDGHDYLATPFEVALSTFLERQHEYASSVSLVALECAGSLAIELIHQVLESVQDNTERHRRASLLLQGSPVWKALQSSRQYFFRQALESQKTTGVSELFVDLVESALTNRYKKLSVPARGTRHLDSHSGPPVYACLLYRTGCGAMSSSPEVLVRKFRSVNPNDVESARFYIQLALHYRALCQVVGTYFSQDDTGELDWIDRADSLCLTIGGMYEKPALGSELDLRGRMAFHFTSAWSTKLIKREQEKGKEAKGSAQRLPPEDNLLFRNLSSVRVLVLDPTDMFVVQPLPRSEVNRGTILACIPLRSVVAAAVDGEWLHVAVRHDDVDGLIRNGNMAICFDSAGNSLVVSQYLERVRGSLRRELMGHIRELFGGTKDAPKSTLRSGLASSAEPMSHYGHDSA